MKRKPAPKKIFALMLFFTCLLSGCAAVQGSGEIPVLSDNFTQVDADMTQAAMEIAPTDEWRSGTEAYTKPTGNSITIPERQFLTQTNLIYANYEDYLGKTIQYEGIFASREDTSTDEPYYFVIRYGPGCCGNDGEVGFEVIWDDAAKAYPNENDWVAVSGVLEEFELEGYQYLRLRLISLDVLDKRGMETVLR